jgi:hypothetical protein
MRKDALSALVAAIAVLIGVAGFPGRSGAG